MRVFISGVSSGIGRSLAEKLLEQGHSVAGVSRRDPEIQHPSFHFQALDVTQAEQVHAVVSQLAQQVGGFDLAVLNAGVLGEIRDMSESSIEAMQQVLDVNLWANKSLIDSLAKQDEPPDQIVAISSGAAVNGNRGWNGYAISKAGLNMMIALYAKELPHIHFTALAPGLVDTAMQDYLCSVDSQQGKYASLEIIQGKRNTVEMPTPDQLAPRLIDAFTKLPNLVTSGDFVDIRKPPLREA